ncbi:MAG: 16S rRNA (adenine(1518)-N(6)/adenine(1519)-N(6))-dimethyltransferase RsmA [Defluviitaleaceae bacterium]|nr:16S rRNA (adenine(1518)-N(6)/adenine(1519)-N(6))-dimethyltransferase RsmA [Defluviitaleaceae bacterium]
MTKIIAAAAPSTDDCVLEIGPGLGALTQGLLAHAGNVVAIELDKWLGDILAAEFSAQAASGQFTLVRGDVLKIDLEAVLAPFRHKVAKVVANLPYYITTPVIMRLLESGLGFASITVMIQKEVAERMSAKPGTKAYGSLTLAVQYHATAEMVAIVPSRSFLPRPEVVSAVICLRALPQPPVEVEKEKLFAVIAAAFATRRKTLVNALHAAGFTAKDGGGDVESGKTGLAAALVACGLRADVRGEALDIYQFAAVAEAVTQGAATGNSSIAAKS